MTLGKLLGFGEGAQPAKRSIEQRDEEQGRGSPEREALLESYRREANDLLWNTGRFSSHVMHRFSQWTQLAATDLSGEEIQPEDAKLLRDHFKRAVVAYFHQNLPVGFTASEQDDLTEFSDHELREWAGDQFELGKRDAEKSSQSY